MSGTFFLKERKSHKIFFRLTDDELKKIKEHALKHADGNISKWIRERALVEPMDDAEYDRKARDNFSS